MCHLHLVRCISMSRSSMQAILCKRLLPSADHKVNPRQQTGLVSPILTTRNLRCGNQPGSKVRLSSVMQRPVVMEKNSWASPLGSEPESSYVIDHSVTPQRTSIYKYIRTRCPESWKFSNEILFIFNIKVLVKDQRNYSGRSHQVVKC